MKPRHSGESECAEYCRKRGLYPINRSRPGEQAYESVADRAGERGRQRVAVDRDARKKVQALERELQRKEKALAETAALLTLSKRAQAIWGEGEDA